MQKFKFTILVLEWPCCKTEEIFEYTNELAQTQCMKMGNSDRTLPRSKTGIPFPWCIFPPLRRFLLARWFQIWTGHPEWRNARTEGRRCLSSAVELRFAPNNWPQIPAEERNSQSRKMQSKNMGKTCRFCWLQGRHFWCCSMHLSLILEFGFCLENCSEFLPCWGGARCPVRLCVGTVDCCVPCDSPTSRGNHTSWCSPSQRTWCEDKFAHEQKIRTKRRYPRVAFHWFHIKPWWQKWEDKGHHWWSRSGHFLSKILFRTPHATVLVVWRQWWNSSLVFTLHKSSTSHMQSLQTTKRRSTGWRRKEKKSRYFADGQGLSNHAQG